MGHRSRLLAAGLTATLTGGMLAATSATASSATTSSATTSAATTKTFSYDCTGTVTQIMMMPIGPPDPVTMVPTMLPMPLPIPVTASVPLAVTLPDSPALGSLAPGQSVPSIPVTGSLGVSWLVSALGGALQTVSTSLSLPLSGAATPLGLALGTAAPTGVAGLVGGELPLTGSVPAFTAPTTPGSYPLSMPASISLPLTDFTSAPSTDTLTCTVGAAVDRLLTTIGVTAPADPGTGGTGGATGGTVSHPVETPKANPCVSTPARQAGQRRTALRAAAAKVSWKKRPTVRLTVTSRRHAARGKVIACYGARKVGQRRLSHGRAVLRTLRFHPGRYRLKLVYLGSAEARATARTITLRVKR